MKFGELLDMVMAVTGVDAPTAMTVAQEVWSGDRAYTENEIRYAAVKLGAVEDTPTTAQEAVAKAHGEMLTDPGEILAEVYKVAPRVLCEHMPVIGRRPMDHELSDEIEQMIARMDIPEEDRVCLLDIDIFSGSATFSLYDEANEVDRNIGPIDLTRYEDTDALSGALTTLLKRLPKVLAADFN